MRAADLRTLLCMCSAATDRERRGMVGELGAQENVVWESEMCVCAKVRE